MAALVLAPVANPARRIITRKSTKTRFMQAMKIIGDDCLAKGTTKYGGLVGYCLQMHADKPSVFAMISSRAHLPQPNIEVNTEFNEVVYRPAPRRAAMEKQPST